MLSSYRVLKTRSKLMYNTYIWQLFLFEAIGGFNKIAKFETPEYGFKFSYTISDKHMESHGHT